MGLSSILFELDVCTTCVVCERNWRKDSWRKRLPGRAAGTIGSPKRLAPRVGPVPADRVFEGALRASPRGAQEAATANSPSRLEGSAGGGSCPRPGGGTPRTVRHRPQSVRGPQKGQGRKQDQRQQSGRAPSEHHLGGHKKQPQQNHPHVLRGARERATAHVQGRETPSTVWHQPQSVLGPQKGQGRKQDQ